MPKVSIVRCNSYSQEKVYKAVQKAVSDLGFNIKRGSKVLLKPNVLSAKRPGSPVTTHPAVIKAVCKVLSDRGCRIIIAESSGWSSTLKNFEACGIKEVADKYNARLVSLSSEDIIHVNIPGARVLKSTKMSGLLFNVDLIINLPKMKTHALTKYTGAVKNIYGCIPGALKQKYHVKAPNEKKFSQLLVDIYSLVRPGLTIMDGIVGMEGNGPSGGEPKKAGLIMASENGPALDSVAERIIGLEGQVYTTRFAAGRGLFDPHDVEVIGEIPKINFRKPDSAISIIPGFIKEHIFVYTTPEPSLIEGKCVKCGTCMKVCMSKAIKMGPYPVFDRKRCIHCYCCHELCPYHAIDLRRRPIIEFMSRVKKKVFS